MATFGVGSGGFFSVIFSHHCVNAQNFVVAGLCPDWDDWTPANPVKNATEAMGAAEQSLDVPQVRIATKPPNTRHTQNFHFLRLDLKLRSCSDSLSDEEIVFAWK